MTVASKTPQVWIGCLAAYNEGTLFGEWVDAVDADVLREAAAQIVKESPAFHAEEWFIADYDGFGEAASTLGEYADFDTVAEIGWAIQETGGAVAAFVAMEGEWDAQRFEESFRGTFDSEQEYAEQLADDLGMFDARTYSSYGEVNKGVEQAMSQLEMYFDWEKWTRDLFLGDFYSVEAGYGEVGVYVFDRNV